LTGAAHAQQVTITKMVHQDARYAHRDRPIIAAGALPVALPEKLISHIMMINSHLIWNWDQAPEFLV